jgi:chromosome segregation ATPase
MMLTPGSSETGAGALENLLGLVTDPKATKERLAQLTKQAQETQKVLDEVKKIQIANEATQKEIDKKTADLDKKIAKYEETYTKNAADLGAREHNLRQSHEDLDVRRTDIDRRAQEVIKREGDLNVNVAAFDDRMRREEQVEMTKLTL